MAGVTGKGVLAAAKIGIGIGRGIWGMAKKRGAGGASLVDPTQSALRNLTQRKYTAGAAGTDFSGARQSAAKTINNVFRKRIKAGARSAGPISALMNTMEGQISANQAQQATALMASLNEQTKNMADRQMDLIEQKASEDKLQGEVAKTTGAKNAYAQAEEFMNARNKEESTEGGDKGKGGDKSEGGSSGGLVDKAFDYFSKDKRQARQKGRQKGRILKRAGKTKNLKGAKTSLNIKGKGGSSLKNLATKGATTGATQTGKALGGAAANVAKNQAGNIAKNQAGNIAKNIGGAAIKAFV